MVKISIKKEEKTIKPKQKQKQRQSQKVIVNIGKDVVKPKRRRAPRKGLEKSRAMTTPNIIIPQAMPQNSMGEILKYIRESEQQKEMIKKQEKNNELEKDKNTPASAGAPRRGEKASVIQKEEKAQSQFSTIDSGNISSLTSGTATPNPLSYPVDSRSLFDSLMRVADIRGENPNSGSVSLSSSVNNPLTFTTLATNNSSRLNYSSNSSSDPLSSQSTIYPRSDSSSVRSFSSSQSNPLSESSNQSSLTDYLDEIKSEPPIQEEPPIIEPPIQEEVVEVVEEPPPPPPEITIEPPLETTNTPPEPLIVEPDPEQQLIIYEPEKATAQTATATQQIMGMDNTSIPAFLRPINAPLPAIHFKDVIGLKPTIAETKDIREARIKKLDKKPVLAIEAQTAQEEATKEDEKKNIFISPKKKDDSIKGVGAFIQGSPIKSNQPSKLTDLLRKSQNITAEEPESQVTGSSIPGFDEFTAYITDAKNIKNKDLGQILIRNKIKDPTTKNTFYIDSHNRVLVRGYSTTLNRTQLTELLKKEYKPGFVYKNI